MTADYIKQYIDTDDIKRHLNSLRAALHAAEAKVPAGYPEPSERAEYNKNQEAVWRAKDALKEAAKAVYEFHGAFTEPTPDGETAEVGSFSTEDGTIEVRKNLVMLTLLMRGVTRCT